MEHLTELFKILSDETRLKILYLLFSSEKPICVCQFVEVLDKTQYNISRHLGLLKKSGLVAREKRGQWAYYSLNPDFPHYELLKDILYLLKNKLEEKKLEEWSELLQTSFQNIDPLNP